LNERRAGVILPAMAKDAEREARLAAALRENLRRRKAQAREKNGDEKKPSES
jgi:hypothetical protein